MSDYLTPDQEKAIAEEKELEKQENINKLRCNTDLYDYLKSHAHIDRTEWIIDDNGVYKVVNVKDKKSEKTDTVTASTTPIIPEGLYRNRDTNIEMVRLDYYHRNRWRNTLVERKTISTKSKILDLSNQGIAVTDDNAKTLMNYFAEIIEVNRFNSAYNRIASSTLGWYLNEETETPELQFIPYFDGVQFDGEQDNGFIFNALKENGTLEEWADYMLPLRKNVIFRLCMASAFASPLIELLSANPFIFHLWGNTGTGKTVSLMAAMSIWGNPEVGKLTRSLNATANSMLSIAAFLRNIPFAGDELQTIKSEFGNYDKIIMSLTEGVDRGRLDTNAKLKQAREWKCSFILTGEEPIIKYDSGGGAVNRVIECELREPLFNDGRAVASFVRKHYGTAGRHYIEKLIELNANGYLEDSFNSMCDYIKQNAPETTDKQLQAMALLLTADGIASDLFWNGREMPGIDITDVKHFLKTKSEVDVSERAYEVIMSIISINAENFKPGALKYWGKIDDDGTVYFLLGEVRRQLAQNGFDYDAFKKKWAHIGYTKTFYDKHGKPIPTKVLKNGKLSVRAVAFPPQETETEYEEVTDPVPEELN